MSRPRIRQDRKQAPSSSPTKNDYTLVPISSPSPTRRRNLSRQPTLYLANGQKFIQRSRIPRPLGQIGLLERPRNALGDPTDSSLNKDSGFNDVEPEATTVIDVPLMSAHQHKRLAQNHRWQTEVLPCLIRPYMSMLRQTDNLRNEASMLDKACTCLNNPRLLEISIVRFTKLQKLVLSVCACRTAAVQLMEQGLFPCAPVHPTLAVDIHVLDFVTRLFLRIGPNNTAWADSINEFLSSQGYQLQGQDPLRRRFGNALQWYNSLQDLTANFVDQVLSIARNYEEGGSEVSDAEVKTVEIAKGKEARESSEDDDSDVDSGSDQPAKKQLCIDSDQEMNHLSRPSEYLRGRCPLCFGGLLGACGSSGPSIPLLTVSSLRCAVRIKFVRDRDSID
ncbi:hypothetical protein DFH05DRAFT_1531117 [Lentinula detonsa]|uniref:CxC1-like cysteine cluster associated with KDZ transposases domain-containing protein n=1 Tax=Lentinula detonsa TaxID=2804962 RepID=A0A9W8NQC6_9AGAR|nr:hypothetical protein DFH05DRAFT_1531117 [Lentinula detonsa]